MLKSEVSQRGLNTRKIILSNNEVEILMWTSLSANERVNPPAAIEPYRDLFALKAIKYGYHITRLHHFRFGPATWRLLALGYV